MLINLTMEIISLQNKYKLHVVLPKHILFFTLKLNDEEAKFKKVK